VSLPFLVTHQAGANSDELNVTATLNDGGVLPVAGSCQGATLTMNRTCVVSAGDDSLPCSPNWVRVPVGVESAIEVRPALGYRVESISGACSSRTACTVNLDRDGGILFLGIDGPYNVAFTTRHRLDSARTQR
jgi:hypothetical protein